MSRATAPPGEASQDGNVARLGGTGSTPRGSIGTTAAIWRAGFFGLIAVAILAAAAWLLLGSSFLVVKHVEVEGNKLETSAQVRAQAAIKLGTPLIKVNSGAVARRVEQIAPVLSATVTRSWPNTIIITVRERTPKLAVAGTGGFQLIDGSGVIVRSAASKPASLPLLTDSPAVLRGSPAVRAAVAVLDQLPDHIRSQVLSVSAPAANAITLHLSTGVTVLWGSASDATQKAAELFTLMSTGAKYYDVSAPGSVMTQG
jgi:cell division protein FtsQ